MLRKIIRKKATNLVKRFSTNDPFTLCNDLNINLLFADLGNNIMGYNTKINRIPSIVINSTINDKEQLVTCCHELGHNQCGHDRNTDFLTKHSLNAQKIGVEYEANCFMTDLLLSNTDVDDYETKDELIKCNNIPKWAEDCIDWNYLFSK